MRIDPSFHFSRTGGSSMIASEATLAAVMHSIVPDSLTPPAGRPASGAQWAPALQRHPDCPVLPVAWHAAHEHHLQVVNDCRLESACSDNHHARCGSVRAKQRVQQGRDRRCVVSEDSPTSVQRLLEELLIGCCRQACLPSKDNLKLRNSSPQPPEQPFVEVMVDQEHRHSARPFVPAGVPLGHDPEDGALEFRRSPAGPSRATRQAHAGGGGSIR